MADEKSWGVRRLEEVFGRRRILILDDDREEKFQKWATDYTNTKFKENKMTKKDEDEFEFIDLKDPVTPEMQQEVAMAYNLIIECMEHNNLRNFAVFSACGSVAASMIEDFPEDYIRTHYQQLSDAVCQKKRKEEEEDD